MPEGQTQDFRRDGLAGSRRSSARRRRAARFAGLFLLPAALFVAACGSTSSSSSTSGSGGTGASSGVAEAQQLVTQAKKPSTFVAPGPSFDASAAKGKLIFLIGDDNSVPFNAITLKGLKAGVTAAGARLAAPDSRGDVDAMVRLVQQAISEHASVVIIPSVNAKVLAAPLAQAKKAGIKVIQTFSADARLPTPSEKAFGVDAIVSYCFSCGGRLMADYTVADSGGKNVDAVGFWDSGVGAAAAQIHATSAELSRLCPTECKITYKDIPSFSDWAQQVPSLTSSSLVHRDLNYFLPIYDGMATYMLPAIHAADASTRVKIVTLNADQAQMESMAKHDVIIANVGTPIEYAGWAEADQSLRLATGHPPVATEKIPLRLFDNSNMPNLKLPERDWYGVNFQAGYEKLWGLS